MRKYSRLAGLAGMSVLVAAIGTVQFVGASSHREAPYISTDPTADATDLYAFVAPDAPGHVTFIANYVPGQNGGDGPNYYKLGDDVLYEINIDNDGDAIEDITYQFRFRSDLNPANAFGGNTFLYNTGVVDSLTDPDLNQRQFYSVSRFENEGGAQRAGTMIADNLQVAPYDVGPKSFPGANYPTVAASAVNTIGSGIKVFVGPRDDPFFVALGPIFDLLNAPAFGVDHLAKKNVHSIAIQIPKAQLTADGSAGTDAMNTNSIIGIRTTAYRQSVRVLRNLGNTGDTNTAQGINRGPWIQVSRLDLPLINEVIIPLKDKDRFNGSRPKNDGQFLGYVDGTAPGSLPGADPAGAAPHLGALLQLVLGHDSPPAPRTDLVDALLLGIPGLNRPAGVAASSQLRLNMAVAPAATPNRLGVVGMDTQGYPNGRRLTDDIIDISLKVVGGVLVGKNTDGLADGVNANDKAFMTTFPYVALPFDYAD